jgi:REP element-mobilizing transposase RayT
MGAERRYMKYNADVHHRRSIRLKEYDYSKEGMYFVTICTNNRENVLSDIVMVGAGFHARPELEQKPYTPECKLTQIGNIVYNCIKGIGQYCKNVEIKECVIMPNHVHMIVYQGGHGNPPLPEIIYKIKSYTTKRYNEINNTNHIKLWQKNYYEHILRNEKDYFKFCNYIQNNPINWENDLEYKN